MYQRAVRMPLRALVQVKAPTGGFDATIGNLSHGGARLVGVPDRMLMVGDRVEIQVLGRSHAAEVRWHFDDTCGLMFPQPLADEEIQSILMSRLLH